MRRVPDERLRRQFVSAECYDSARRGDFQGIDIPRATKSRHSKCKNRLVDGGWSVGEYAPDDLVTIEEGRSTYCIRRSDAKRVAESRVNPRTMQALSDQSIQRLTEAANEWGNLGPVRPLSVQLDEIFNQAGRLPLWRSEDPRVIYIYSCHSLFEVGKPGRVAPMAGPKPCVGRIYRVHLAEPYREGVTDKFDVVRQEIFAECKLYESSPRPSDDDTVRIFHYPKALAAIKASRERRLTPEEAREIRSVHDIRSSSPMTLYAGLSFDDPSEIGKEVFIGDTIDLGFKETNPVWTASPCVAASFAAQRRYGMVVEITVSPDEVMLDTRRLMDREELSVLDMGEVMLFEPRKRRTVRVHMLSRGLTDLWRRES